MEVTLERVTYSRLRRGTLVVENRSPVGYSEIVTIRRQTLPAHVEFKRIRSNQPSLLIWAKLATGEEIRGRGIEQITIVAP